MRPAPRLYTEAGLGRGSFSFDQAQARYLGSVLRLGAGDTVRLFNGRDGEWVYEITEITKRSGEARPLEHRREQVEAEGPTLLFAPLKRGPTEILVQKATELGVGTLQPVITARTNRDKLRTDRMETIAIEAAEQCERLTIPRVEEPVALDAALSAVDGFVFCDEAGDNESEPWGGDEGRAPLAAKVFGSTDASPRAILIGPEGGFTPEERARLRADSRALPISLGPRILRAETAAIVALTLWQLRFGDLA
ncbi:16S rRNA (uracil(1498)-N(3))-methyltransferase [Parvularcula lutaonensis]|uniref:Ribosomal RNA small subunit methyltransferase E n=1 Tax=Parvularcula lutaonensis TaxID=491923 RepID=A0ABV7M744_9PROT|nr:16S rRNA (uracil(1498)-N(3))-methyltransferase [Parvularcula lutaonensis]GGY41099.1 ribosomal RNA small subunit methyltransferase E [Parvularcula lutaonensis]